MCQYSAADGCANDWHLQHLGARAAGGAGIVFVEAAAVSQIGRITHGCLGLWNDEQQQALARIAALIERCGAVPAIQIAHAGRKASTEIPWLSAGSVRIEGDSVLPSSGGWQPVGPSPLAFKDDMPIPHELSRQEIAELVDAFGQSARRAREAGFRLLDIHAAHGYLLHSFLSPLSNRRHDDYGGSVAGRRRLLMEVIDAVRGEWPAELPLFVRLSCSEYVAEGIDIAATVSLAQKLKQRGDVDLIDCSSGGGSPLQKIPNIYAGYQVAFAETIRRSTGIATGAVGLIRHADHANDIVASGRADLVLIGRAMLADPAWPIRAAAALRTEIEMPPPYQRALTS